MPFSLSLTYQGRPIQMLGTPDDPLWVAADACKLLGFSPHSRPLRDFDDDERAVRTAHTLGGPQDVDVLTEAGLFRLILMSRRPEARPFRRWVCHEVLPCVRRFGRYPAERRPSELAAPTVDGLFGPMPAPALRHRLPAIAADVMPRAELIPLAAVPSIDWLPCRLSPRTVYSWHRFGRRGLHLAAARIGTKLYTTESAVLAFCTGRAEPNPASPEGSR